MLAVTFHAALLLGSDDTYGGRPELIVDRQGTIDEWAYRVTVGAVPPNIREYISTTPNLFQAILSPSPAWANSPDPLAARDEAVAELAAQYTFSPPWNDDERAFTAIEVWKQVDVSTDPARGVYRYCWYELKSAEQAVSTNYSDGIEVAQFLLAVLLPQVGDGHLTHRWKAPLAWLELDGGGRCAVPKFTAGAVAVVRRANSDALVNRLATLSLPDQVRREVKEKLATIGRWHSVAAAEEDAFRRFLWYFAGIEVISRAVASVGRAALLQALTFPGAPVDGSAIIQELLWPSRDDGRDPDRNLVFSFSAMAVILAPQKAAEDVQTFRRIAKYRNQIHGGAFDPNDSPSREVSELWRRYSPLATRFLVSQ